MSKIQIEKHMLLKIRDDIEQMYCDSEGIKLEELRKNNKTKLVNLIGTFLDSQGKCGQSYPRQNIYEVLDLIQDKPDDHQVAVSRDFPYKIKSIFNESYWTLLAGNFLGVSSNEAKKIIYRNTQWMYFYYDEIDGVPGISTGALHINENNNISIKDILQDIPKPIAYEGGMRFILDGSLLIMTLATKDTRERDLHIALQVGNHGTPPEVMVGQYHNVNSSGTIVSGSLIVQSSKFTNEEFIPTFYPKGSPAYLTLKAVVRSFFDTKANNRIKIPKTGYTYTNLRRWIKSKETNRRKIAVKHEKPKLFISAPTTSLDSIKNYNLFKDTTTRLTKVLNEKFNVEVLCTLLKFESYEHFRESNILLSEILEELNSCNYFMMIFPNLKLKRQSSILLEFGYMLSKAIPQIIMVEKGIEDTALPNLLKGAITNGTIKKYTFIDFEDLIKKVDTNGLELF